MTNFVVATNEFRGNGAPERTEYHNLVAWDRLAEICGQFLSRRQRIDIVRRLQMRQWDDDSGVRHLVQTWHPLPSSRRRRADQGV